MIPSDAERALLDTMFLVDDTTGTILPFCAPHGEKVNEASWGGVMDEATGRIVGEMLDEPKPLSRLREEGVPILTPSEMTATEEYQADKYNRCPSTAWAVCGALLAPGEALCEEDYDFYASTSEAPNQPDERPGCKMGLSEAQVGSNEPCKQLTSHTIPHEDPEGAVFKSVGLQKADNPTSFLCFGCESYAISKGQCLTCAKEGDWVLTNFECEEHYLFSKASLGETKGKEWLEKIK